MVHCVVVQWHDRQRVDDPVLVCMHECTWQVSLCVNDEEMWCWMSEPARALLSCVSDRCSQCGFVRAEQRLVCT